MRLARSATTTVEPMESEHFRGMARRRDLGATDAPNCRTLVVSFEPGARTNWHAHSDGQLIYGLEGRGHVGVRSGETVEIGPGDLVHAPPGEEHWHGASPDAALTHLALSFGETVWLEEVE
jgi:quercetin dioxygenase-like cupin family protein